MLLHTTYKLMIVLATIAGHAMVAEKLQDGSATDVLKDSKPDQVPDLDRPSVKSKAGNCIQYKIFKAEDKINMIISKFGLKLPDLKELNPQLDWKGPQEVGTPLCDRTRAHAIAFVPPHSSIHG